MCYLVIISVIESSSGIICVFAGTATIVHIVALDRRASETDTAGKAHGCLRVASIRPSATNLSTSDVPLKNCSCLSRFIATCMNGREPPSSPQSVCMLGIPIQRYTPSYEYESSHEYKPAGECKPGECKLRTSINLVSITPNLSREPLHWRPSA